MTVAYNRGKVTPVKITGDLKIKFKGEGTARFRIQHTGDYKGEPDEVFWCDVTKVYGVKGDFVLPRGEYKGGFLVDEVCGSTVVTYYKRDASWLRVLPLDDYEQEDCKQYKVTISGVDGCLRDWFRSLRKRLLAALSITALRG